MIAFAICGRFIVFALASTQRRHGRHCESVEGIVIAQAICKKGKTSRSHLGDSLKSSRLLFPRSRIHRERISRGRKKKQSVSTLSIFAAEAEVSSLGGHLEGRLGGTLGPEDRRLEPETEVLRNILEADLGVLLSALRGVQAGWRPEFGGSAV